MKFTKKRVSFICLLQLLFSSCRAYYPSSWSRHIKSDAHTNSAICCSCLCGITVFFNPLNYTSRKENYIAFRKKTAEQGLWLLTVELAYSKDAAFIDKKNGLADEVVQIILEDLNSMNHEDFGYDYQEEEFVSERDKSLMWQKERLLNIGLQSLPPTPACPNVAWLDADVVFLDDDWISHSCKALEEFNVIQPFSSAVRLDYAQTKQVTSIPHGIMHSQLPNVISQPDRVIAKVRSQASTLPGFAWVAKRNILDKIGFFDKAIVGGADTLMAAAFQKPFKKLLESLAPYQYGIVEEFDSTIAVAANEIPLTRIPAHFAAINGVPKLARAFLNWARPVYNLTKGRIGVLEVENEESNIDKENFCCSEDISRSSSNRTLVLHLWHGEIRNRQYGHRHRILVHGKFDPDIDIELNEKGIWRWSKRNSEIRYSGRKNLMHKKIKRFFENRKEDSV